MPDEFAEDLWHLLTKYCGSKFDYNWDEWADGKIYLRLTMKLKPEYNTDTEQE